MRPVAKDPAGISPQFLASGLRPVRHAAMLHEEISSHVSDHAGRGRVNLEESNPAASARDMSETKKERRCCKCTSNTPCNSAGSVGLRQFCDGPSDSSLVSSVATLLQQLSSQSSSEGCGAPCFLSATEPLISVPDYLARLSRFFQCSKECFVLSVIYIDRMLQSNSHVWLCALNVHRLAVTALTLAVKFAEDTFYSNAYYAKVGGLPLREMNHLEATLLRMVGFRLHVLPWEYHKYLRLILGLPPAAGGGRPKFFCAGTAAALCSSASSCAATPSPNDAVLPSKADENCCTGKATRHCHCCGSPSSTANPCRSPLTGSTCCLSRSSQSVSPPFSPEATENPRSPTSIAVGTRGAAGCGGGDSCSQCLRRGARSASVLGRSLQQQQQSQEKDDPNSSASCSCCSQEDPSRRWLLALLARRPH